MVLSPNPSIWETDVGRSGIQSQPHLHKFQASLAHMTVRQNKNNGSSEWQLVEVLAAKSEGLSSTPGIDMAGETGSTRCPVISTCML